MNTWIQTVGGHKVDAFNLDPKTVWIDDIAHSLSMLCRYTGHTKHHYSVAQHSVHVADIMYENTQSHRKAFIAILHEMSESILNDLARPIKRHLTQYDEIESKLLRQLYECIGVSNEEMDSVWPEVKIADNLALCREAHDLFDFPPIDNWTDNYTTNWVDPYRILPKLYPEQAKALFLERYSKYRGY